MRLRMTSWKLKEIERELFVSVDSVPNWKLADKARRMLMDMVHRLSRDMPPVVADRPRDIPAAVAQQVAIVGLAGIAVRSVGSTMSLIACGYVPESAGPARRGLEAMLRGRAVTDDSSGQHARDWLQRPMGGLTKLAEKYGQAADLELLSAFAHADASGLRALRTGPIPTEQVAELEVNLHPGRDPGVSAVMLYAAAYESVGICGLLAEAFDVAFQVPPWVSGELLRNRDALAKLAQAKRSAQAAA